MFKDTTRMIRKGMTYIMAVAILAASIPVMSYEVKAADAFETSISGFPESYKTYLRELHKKYPNWVFKPYNTGLNFADAVSNEASSNRSLVEKSYNDYLKSKASGDYNASTGAYIAKDGNSWVSASRNTVAYFMDPRNFLNDTHIAMFEQLSYDASVHTQAGVEAILSGSFMYNTNMAYLDSSGKYLTTTTKYSAQIISAAKSSGVSPYYLASKILQEIGKGSNTKYAGMGSSNSINGANATYKGIYNFYNIGASDGANAVLNGLKWASTGTTYSRPWNTPGKSITGGASYIGEKYIKCGQDTTYFQRFNVRSDSSYPLYTHQYMTNIYGCASEAATTMSAYASLGITAAAKTFLIPVYNNMPDENATVSVGNATKQGVVLTNVNMREGPSTSHKVVVTLNTNDVVTINECVPTDELYSVKWLNNPYWYKVSVTKNGVNYVGYVSSDNNYIDVSSELNIIKGVGTKLNCSVTNAENVYYEVDDPTVLTVDATGTVNGLKNGTTTVRVYTMAGKFNVITITVIEKGAVLDVEKLSLQLGESRTLVATVYPLNSTDKTVTWSSSDTKVATVSANGKVTAKGYGTAVITAKAAVGGVEGKCTVTVVKPTTGVKLNKSKATVYVGNTLTLKATVSPSDATDKSVQWKSADKKIATVKNGVVTPVKPGKVKITVTSNSGAKTASCTVTVKPQKIAKVTVKSTSYNKIKLSWTAQQNVTGYKVYRMNAAGKYKSITKTTKTSYTDQNLTAGKKYKYKVAAYATVGNKTYIGAKSDVITKKATPPKVAIQSITAVGTNKAKITWAKSSGASGYCVYKKAPGAVKYTKIKNIKSGSTRKLTVKNLTAGQTYSYKVRPYRTVNKKKIYGKYSAAYSIIG